MHKTVQQDLYPDIFAVMCGKASTMATVQKFLEDTTDSRLPSYVVSGSAHGFSNGFVLAKTNQVSKFARNARIYDRSRRALRVQAFFYADSPAEASRYVAAHHHEGCYLKREWFSAPTRQRPRYTERVVDTETQKRYWRFNQSHCDGTLQNVLFELPASANGSFANPPPLDIQLPAMQQILHFQEFSPEMQLWLYAMIGRMLLPVATLDSFSVIVLLSGATQVSYSPPCGENFRSHSRLCSEWQVYDSRRLHGCAFS